MQNNDEYKAALDKAEKELEDLVTGKELIEKRILNLTATVESLRVLCGVQPISFQQELRGIGLTDAVRRILESSNTSLSPTQIRSILLAARFDLSDQSNVMASIHSVLKRLTEAGEIIRDQIGEETVYLWLTPLRRALLKEAEDRRRFRREAFVETKVGPAPPPTVGSVEAPPPTKPYSPPKR
jgi:hypothetical protein